MRLPIQGLPIVRPRCVACGKAFRPRSRDVCERRPYPGGGFQTVTVARHFSGWDAYNGLFHTMRCALGFATAAHAAGYRLSRPTSDGARVATPHGMLAAAGAAL